MPTHPHVLTNFDTFPYSYIDNLQSDMWTPGET